MGAAGLAPSFGKLGGEVLAGEDSTVAFSLNINIRLLSKVLEQQK